MRLAPVTPYPPDMEMAFIQLPEPVADRLIDDELADLHLGSRSDPSGLAAAVSVVGLTADLTTIALSAALLPQAVRYLYNWLSEVKNPPAAELDIRLVVNGETTIVRARGNEATVQAALAAAGLPPDLDEA